MAHQETLTEKQLLILRWIAGGCPDGIMDDDAHRISAAALRNRGLVSISGRGPTTRAEATEAVRDYLARADGPTPPTPRQANVSGTE